MNIRSAFMYVYLFAMTGTLVRNDWLGFAWLGFGPFVMAGLLRLINDLRA